MAGGAAQEHRRLDVVLRHRRPDGLGARRGCPRLDLVADDVDLLCREGVLAAGRHFLVVNQFEQFTPVGLARDDDGARVPAAKEPGGVSRATTARSMWALASRASTWAVSRSTLA